jgi:hypothetical protein
MAMQVTKKQAERNGDAIQLISSHVVAASRLPQSFGCGFQKRQCLPTKLLLVNQFDVNIRRPVMGMENEAGNGKRFSSHCFNTLEGYSHKLQGADIGVFNG